jgi:hypothetical protein
VGGRSGRERGAVAGYDRPVRAGVERGIAAIAGPRAVARPARTQAIWMLVVVVFAGSWGLWAPAAAYLDLVQGLFTDPGDSPLLGSVPIDPYWETWSGNADVRAWPTFTDPALLFVVLCGVGVAGELRGDRRLVFPVVVGLAALAVLSLAAGVAFGPAEAYLLAAVLGAAAAASAWRMPRRDG